MVGVVCSSQIMPTKYETPQPLWLWGFSLFLGSKIVTLNQFYFVHFKQKLPVELVAKITGHKKIETLLNVYYNPTADELYDAMYGDK